jgi:pyrroline-5-carboxylate reductase
MKVAILGLGSIARGVVAALELAPDVTEVVGTRRSSAPGRDRPAGVTVLSVQDDPGANVEAVRGAQVVFGCVKPHQLPALLEEVAPVLDAGTIVVSVAAGVGFTSLRTRLGPGPRLVRLMPNTPTRLGEGVVGVLAERPGSLEQRLLSAWFSRVGQVVPPADEADVDVLSAVSGSGPVYVFRLAEAMTDAAVAHGLSAEHAEAVVRRTIIGAAALLQDSPTSAAQLRRHVTSPGGTTEQAMAVLERGLSAELFAEAFAASLRRARELDGS